MFSVCISSSGAAFDIFKSDNIEIDGYLDGSYNNIFSCDLKTETSSNYKIFQASQSSDRSLLENVKVSVSSAWDNNFLYLYIDISGFNNKLDNSDAKWYGNSIIIGAKSSSGLPVVYSVAEYSSFFRLACIDSSGLGIEGSKYAYTETFLPSAVVRCFGNQCVYEIAFSWKAFGISPCDNMSVPFNIAFIFNSVPYSRENFCGLQMADGFIEGIVSDDLSSSFSSEIILDENIKTNKHIHSAGEAKTIESSTCLVHGKEIVFCKTCNEIIETNELPLVPHKEGKAEISKDSKNSGYEYWDVRCVWCGILLSRNSVRIDSEEKYNSKSEKPHKHTPGKWETVSFADCTSEGLKVKKCKDCFEVIDSEIIPVKKHRPGPWKTVLFPSATGDGEKVKKCKLCGLIIERCKITSENDLSFSSDKFSYFAKRYILAATEMNSIDMSLYPSELIAELTAAYSEFTEQIDAENIDLLEIAVSDYEAAYRKLSEYSIPFNENETDISPAENLPVEVNDKYLYILIYTLIIFFVIFFLYFLFKITKNKFKT